jgi:hypothetical protein
MEDKVILEGNKLIAEFMGMEYHWYPKNNYYARPQHTFFEGNKIWGIEDLKFHSSWDWLMPVIERIESLGYRWEIGMSTTSPYHYCKIWSIGSIEGISPLDAIYGACIEFIKWYNKQTEFKTL